MQTQESWGSELVSWGQPLRLRVSRALVRLRSAVLALPFTPSLPVRACVLSLSLCGKGHPCGLHGLLAPHPVGVLVGDWRWEEEEGQLFLPFLSSHWHHLPQDRAAMVLTSTW